MNKTRRNLYKWNPVYNWVMGIKDKFFNKFGFVDYEVVHSKSGRDISCVEYWIAAVGAQDDLERASGLIFNQNESRILIHYNNPFAEDFWTVYDGFYMEARSLVIDVKEEQIILAPFRKFRNFGEGGEYSVENIMEKINKASSIEVSNKLDGSMQSAIWNNDKVFMAGSGAIDPEKSWQLEDGYRMINSSPNYVRMLKDHPDLTFIFEYISLKNSLVVQYSKEDEGLHLIGARSIFNGKQCTYEFVNAMADMYNVKATELYNKTFKEILKDVKTYKAEEKEGFVLNVDGFLVKVKCDDYVKIHKFLSNKSSENMVIRAIADGTLDDLYAKIPSTHREIFNDAVDKVKAYIIKTDTAVHNYYEEAPKDTKKDFMIWANKNVPKDCRAYVIAKYLGSPINYLKSRGDSPHYKTMKELGYAEASSSIALFNRSAS